MYALIREIDSYYLVSDSKFGLAHTHGMQLDYDTFTMYIYGKKDTISYSKEDFTISEFEREASIRYIEVLCRDYRYILFKEVE